MRTDVTPAAAIFAITARRVASLYWLHVQWNWTPTAGGTTVFGVCVAALADVAAQQSRAAMGAMRRGIARKRVAPPQVGSLTRSGEIASGPGANRGQRSKRLG